MKLKVAAEVTAPLAALGLIGGYLTARESGIRPLGGVVLGLSGIYAGRTWVARAGWPGAAALSAILSAGSAPPHPLAKGRAWPAVLGVAAVSAAASYVVADRH